ncbi:MAG: sensor histidine kinase, partial [Bacteroidota bacterium]
QEKLASLGQLTAGIAHEIKNPLNFVTNFAKLSMELVDEVIDSENPDERKEAGDYLRKNIEKIFEHGTRADSIVKGMLEHTRASSGGSKNPENVNMICEQFLKISLEAFKMNHAEFETGVTVELDHNIPKISVAPLDISKVFLNIFMNAFYSMNERKKSNPEHKPALEVRSEIIGQSAQFSITDNGTGLPAEVIGRVFNPFFTTKPTGKGTGLGLSISNDIIKAHGGSIKCQNLTSGGAVFHIDLPLGK